MELGQLVWGNPTEEHEVDRHPHGEHLYDLSEHLCALNPDPWGDMPAYGKEYDGPVFTMRPYWWGYCACSEDATEADEVACTCTASLPNFHHKPSDLRIHWYKYIGRSMTANRPVTGEELAAIVAECRASLPPKPEKKPRAKRARRVK